MRKRSGTVDIFVFGEKSRYIIREMLRVGRLIFLKNRQDREPSDLIVATRSLLQLQQNPCYRNILQQEPCCKKKSAAHRSRNKSLVAKNHLQLAQQEPCGNCNRTLVAKKKRHLRFRRHHLRRPIPAAIDGMRHAPRVRFAPLFLALQSDFAVAATEHPLQCRPSRPSDLPGSGRR